MIIDDFKISGKVVREAILYSNQSSALFCAAQTVCKQLQSRFTPEEPRLLPVAPVRSQLFVCCLMKSVGCPTVKAANAASFDLNIGFRAAAALLNQLC